MSRIKKKTPGDFAIRSKIWIEADGKPVFGRGRRFLLEAIDRCGSINGAAKEIDISYRKVWSYIQAMEERLGLALLERRKGGRNGGGAVLTEDAHVFLEKFRELEDGMREADDRRYERIFGSRE